MFLLVLDSRIRLWQNRDTNSFINRIRRYFMSVEAHIEQLRERHSALESELMALISSPSSSDRELADVKRQKLRLKDEIHRLKAA